MDAKGGYAQCFSLSAEKTKIKDRTTNAEFLIMRIIWGLNIVVRLSGERIKTGEIMESDEEGSIINCLTNKKRPWMEFSID
ncbi:MAG: hypothetical protein JRI30_02300 [Deltaproteobacteria bacterium]|nr:hypothetical protein [Deltaproteobacteria bacterium]